MKKTLGFAAIFLCYAAVFAGTSIQNLSIGYTVVLPDNWVCDSTNSREHLFYDTSDTYLSSVGICRVDFEGNPLFVAPEEWTRANFISYTFSVQADSLYSILAYTDTVNALHNGKLKAADAYTYYYEANDTLVSNWAEYIRFTAIGTRGYEIYAIGPRADLDSNITFCASLIESITILDTANASIRTKRPSHFVRTAYTQPLFRVNALGKKLPGIRSALSSQLILSQQQKTVRFSR